MRVISGSAGGRRLKGPPSTATRPMADKIKGAVFNSLASLGVEPRDVLDLYAGTGNIGIEALSRGARRAVFVDAGREQCATVRANLQTTGFSDVASVHQSRVDTFIGAGTGRGTFDFVILDPPYSDPDILPTLERVGTSPLLQSGGILLIGHSPRVTMPERVGPLECLRNRCHGDSCFSIYEKAMEPAAADAGGEVEEER